MKIPIKQVLTIIGFILSAVKPAQTAYQVIALPVNIYCYEFEAAPELSCTISERDIERLIEEVNLYWEQAGITWSVAEIINLSIDENIFPPLSGDEDRQTLKNRFFAATSINSSKSDVWNIGIIKKFSLPAGGIYFPKTHTVMYAETTPRGNTTPFVLAHELGHSLSLAHTDGANNLMSVGNPEGRNHLTEEQIAVVRTQAKSGPATREDMMGLTSNVKPGQIDGRRKQGNQSNSNADLNERRQRIVQRINSFDKNGDGIILLEDTPERAHKVFKRIDQDNDGKIVQSELDRFVQGP